MYEILHRSAYRGEIVWNQTRKRDRWGQARPSRRADADLVCVPAPHLGIVSDAQWEAAHARLRGISMRLATAQGDRPIIRRDRDSKYLLTGFARCASCGDSLAVVSRSHGRRRAYFYGCLAHRKRGETVCPNGFVMRMERVDDAVLRAIGGDVLRPAVINGIINAVFAALTPEAVIANTATLRADLRRVDGQIAALTAAIEDGAAMAPLVAQLQRRQTEREGLLTAIAAAEAVTQMTADREDVRRKVLAQVASWRALLTTQVEDGRRLLRETLDGPLTFTAEERGYRFTGTVTTGALIAGLAGCTELASPAGRNSSWAIVRGGRRPTCSRLAYWSRRGGGGGVIRITERGRQVLTSTEKIDSRYLRRFPEFLDFQRAISGEDEAAQSQPASAAPETTPEEPH